MADLSDQRKRFARFIVIDGMNQSDAYIAAGYKVNNLNSAKANACRLLTNDNVQKYMDDLRAEIQREAVLDAAHFARRLERIADAAEKTLFYRPPQGDTETPDHLLDMTPKEAADAARTCSMDAARLLGELIQKTETTIITHEDRLAAYREKQNGRRPDRTLN